MGKNGEVLQHANPQIKPQFRVLSHGSSLHSTGKNANLATIKCNKVNKQIGKKSLQTGFEPAQAEPNA